MSKLLYGQTNSFPASGNVGVGTVNPQTTLQVNGTVTISNPAGFSYDENLRLPSSNAGYACIAMGAISATSGSGPGQWSLIKFPVVESSRFSIRHFNDDYFNILTNGNVGIGIISPVEKLSVRGKIRAQEIKVETANWPDYVFAKGYQLPSLKETEKHIRDKGHLPDIPSAEEVKANGVDLGEMNAKLLKKIEELTLHLINQDKEISEQKRKIDQNRSLFKYEIENLKQLIASKK